MKKILIKLSFIIAFTISSTALLAQGPPDPPGDPGTGDPIGGGGAPIGSGVGILLALGVAYGGKKLYTLYSKNTETLEE